MKSADLLMMKPVPIGVISSSNFAMSGNTHLVAHNCRAGNAARHCQTFEAYRKVYAVTWQVFPEVSSCNASSCTNLYRASRHVVCPQIKRAAACQREARMMPVAGK